MQVLADLHQHRSHRDLKPQNIMVAQKSGRVSVTLIDFAGSRLHEQGKRLSTAVDISSCLQPYHDGIDPSAARKM